MFNRKRWKKTINYTQFKFIRKIMLFYFATKKNTQNQLTRKETSIYLRISDMNFDLFTILFLYTLYNIQALVRMTRLITFTYHDWRHVARYKSVALHQSDGHWRCCKLCDRKSLFVNGRWSSVNISLASPRTLWPRPTNRRTLTAVCWTHFKILQMLMGPLSPRRGAYSG
jgi:hypothetical protein